MLWGGCGGNRRRRKRAIFVQMLFDDMERVHDGPADVGETEFEFLNRSSLVEATEAREKIEELLAHYPPEGLTHLLARLRSDNQNFHGALFELVLYSAFLRLGCHVELSDIDESAKRPDFLIQSGDDRCYVEATVVDPKEGSLESNVFERDVLAKLETLERKGLGLFVDVEGTLNRFLRKSNVTQPFRQLFEAHDAADIKELTRRHGYDATPSAAISDGNWKLRGRLIAINSEQIVHGVSGEAQYIDPTRSFEARVTAKAQKYRGLDAPLVVADNARELGFDIRRGAMRALFGEMVVDIPLDRNGFPMDGVEPRSRRSPGGIWNNRDGTARYTRLKAVMTTLRLGPYKLDAPVMTYFNPHVDTSELPDVIYTMPHAVGNNGVMEFFDGNSLRQLLFNR